MTPNKAKLASALKWASAAEAKAITAYIESGSVTKAASKLGLNKSTVSRSLHRISAKYDRQQHNSPDGFEAVKVSTDGKGKTTAVKHRPIPVDERPPPPDHVIKGVSTLYDASGEVSAQWVKTQRSAEQQWNAFVQATEAHVNQYTGLAGITSPPEGRTMADVRSYYVIGDMHVGLLSWAKETGTNMNLKKIVQLAQEATSMLVRRTMPSTEAVLVNVGDFFHADDDSNRTSSGKVTVDMDSRYNKVIETGEWLMRDMITMLRTQHKTVRVVTALGNHDRRSSFGLYMFLKALYHNDPDVIIEEPHRPLQTYMYGKNLVGVTHGDTLKMQKIPEVLATQCRKTGWADAEYCWVMTGHIHHKQKLEVGGVVVESFNTLNASDHWHASHGFVGSGRWFESVTLSEAGGECARARVTVNSKGKLI